MKFKLLNASGYIFANKKDFVNYHQIQQLLDYKYLHLYISTASKNWSPNVYQNFSVKVECSSLLSIKTNIKQIFTFVMPVVYTLWSPCIASRATCELRF